MRPRSGLLALAIALFASLPTRADLILTVADAQISPGGTGFVDVFVRSDSPGGDLLANAGFQLQITTAGPSRLEFSTIQPDPQLSDPDYVFFGDSFKQNAGLPVGDVYTTVVPGDTYIGSDGTDSFANVLVTGDRLLARVAITAATALAPRPGDVFTIGLVPLANSDPQPTDITLFTDNGLPPALLAYVSTLGEVQVVPEPSGAVSLAAGSIALLAPLRRRRS